ncbi:MAG TPA: hypothetical protein VGQ36_15530 [Thermoanaerobaculia bacterium]|nr:hypothetical protein [Thermoanaerobaculia bacterium]
MKHRTIAVLFTLALLALPAMGASSVLTPGGVRYAIEATPDGPRIEITRAEGEARARLVVPSTQDAISEKQAQLAFDSMTDTLYVVWTREGGAAGAEIRYVALNAAGHWSSPRNVAAGSGMYRGLQLALTRSEHGGVTATLMHVAWWSINGPILDPEYAMFAFEKGTDATVEVANLEEMANVGDGVTASEYEEVGEAIHPPLTMERNGDSVDVAFGSVSSTAITLLNIRPRKIGSEVRIWKPVGRTGVLTPKSQLVSSDSTPVQAILKGGLVALYTLGDDFNFVVLKKNNSWTTLRSVHVDEDNTSADLVRDLRAAMEEISEDEETGGSEEAETH